MENASDTYACDWTLCGSRADAPRCKRPEDSIVGLEFVISVDLTSKYRTGTQVRFTTFNGTAWASIGMCPS